MDDLAQLKQRSRRLWELGDYAAVARRLEPVAEEDVAAAGIRPGDSVLDAGAGNGNVAVAAARAGARVTAADVGPALVAAGRERTAALGLDVRWDEADMEDLPYPDEAFDAVVSTFGLMFAPRPEVAVAEAFRVVRPGGVVVMSAWTPDGFTGQVTALLGEYLAAPLGAPQPIEWGIESVLRKRLGAQAESLELARGAITWEFPSLDETMAWQEANFGALIGARAALGEERYPELRARFAGLIREWNRGGEGAVRLPAAYVRAVARRGDAGRRRREGAIVEA